MKSSYQAGRLLTMGYFFQRHAGQCRSLQRCRLAWPAFEACSSEHVRGGKRRFSWCRTPPCRDNPADRHQSVSVALPQTCH